MMILCRRQRFLHSFLELIHPMSIGYSKSLSYYFVQRSIHLLGWFALILFYTCHLSWEYHQSPLRFSAPESYCCRLMSPNQIVWNIFPKCQRHFFDCFWTILHTMGGLLVVRRWTTAVEYRSVNRKFRERKWIFFLCELTKNKYRWNFALRLNNNRKDKLPKDLNASHIYTRTTFISWTLNFPLNTNSKVHTITKVYFIMATSWAMIAYPSKNVSKMRLSLLISLTTCQRHKNSLI